MSEAVVDTRSEFGERAERRLRSEPIGWLATVTGDGTPHVGPVWFLRDDDGRGGDVVIATGMARIVDDIPPAHRNGSYIAKYGGMIAERLRMTPEAFADDNAVPIRVDGVRVRGH
jgi:hypothetical protein